MAATVPRESRDLGLVAVASGAMSGGEGEPAAGAGTEEGGQEAAFPSLVAEAEGEGRGGGNQYHGEDGHQDQDDEHQDLGVGHHDHGERCEIHP